MATGFGASVAKNSQKLLEKAEHRIQIIAHELFVAIVKTTPIDKGLLINNWFPEVGSSFSSNTTSSADKAGGGSLARINSVVKVGNSNFKSEISYTLSNNIPYSYLAEVTGWNPPQWKGTPPYRMVALSLQAVAAKYR